MKTERICLKIMRDSLTDNVLQYPSSYSDPVGLGLKTILPLPLRFSIGPNDGFVTFESFCWSPPVLSYVAMPHFHLI